MNAWKNHLRADPTEWLLEQDNPSVRYFTLRDILRRSERSSELKAAMAAIMQTGPVPRILQRQKPGGFWGKPEQFYVYSKYKGTVWNLIVLAQLGADPKDQRIKAACEFLLKWSQDPKGGGFAIHGTRAKGGKHRQVIPCLTGNMVWVLIRFGYLHDPRLRRGIDWITTYQRFDDADTRPPRTWPYENSDHCWGKHTCMMGVAKTLKALAEIPPGKRTRPVNQTIEQAVEFLLKHHLYKQSHDLRRVAKPDWLKLEFPHIVEFDLLDMLDVLTRLGCRDKRMSDAVKLLESKQNREGRWPLERSFGSRLLVPIERAGKTSKWLTLYALRVLKRLYP